MENVISIRDLSLHYPKFSMEHLNLDIPRGYVTGIIGRNGAGKTTLLNMAVGAVRPECGRIDVFGADVGEFGAELRNRIGFVPGAGYYYNSLTVRKNRQILAPFYRDWDDTAFERYLRLFEIEPDKKVGELSAGMRVKLSIAFALSHNAELFLMDEPTAGLDPVVREEFLELLAELMQDEKNSAVFSTHITGDLDKIADYIVLLADGKVELQEEKDTLLERHRVVKGGRESLAPALRDALIGCQEHEFGFTGLTDAPRAFADGAFTLERPTVEDILLFYTRRNEKRPDGAREGREE